MNDSTLDVRSGQRLVTGLRLLDARILNSPRAQASRSLCSIVIVFLFSPVIDKICNSELFANFVRPVSARLRDLGDDPKGAVGLTRYIRAAGVR